MSTAHDDFRARAVEMRARVRNDAVAARFDRTGMVLSDDAVKWHLDRKIDKGLQRRIARRKRVHRGEIHLA